MDSWNELIKAFELGLITPDKVPEPVEYRLHYDDNGKIIMCSSHNHPENTNYLVVSETEFKNYFMYRIEDKQLVVIKAENKFYVKPVQRVIYEKNSFPKNASILKDYE